MSEEGAEASDVDAEAGTEEAEFTEANESDAFMESGGSAEHYADFEDSESSNYHSDTENVKDKASKSSGVKEGSAKTSAASDISDKLKDVRFNSVVGTIDENLETTVEDHVQGYLKTQDVFFDELYNIIKGFLTPGDSEEDHDVYKAIDRKAKDGEPLTFLLPGLFQFPYSAKDFEKYSGLETIRLATRDPDEIHEILSYAAGKTKMGSILIGYSDGEIRARNYVKKHGDGNISMFYGLESDKSHMESIMDPSRVVYIDGDGFLIRKLSPVFPSLTRDFYAPTSATRVKIDGASHSGLVHSQAATEVGRIIEETAKIKYLNFAANNNLKPVDRAA
jgi:hypothetical protein